MARTKQAAPRRAQKTLASLSLALLLASCSMRVSTPENVESITCLHAMDCPTSANPCVVSTCYEQHCLMVAAAAQTVLQQQNAGDCKMRVCDGNGGVTEINDDIDVPTNHTNECTSLACKDGASAEMPVEMGETCGEKGVCNGKGACGVCLPGALRCEDRSLATCTEEGQWESAECPATKPICAAQACIGPQKLDTGPFASCAHFTDGSVRCFGAEGFRAENGMTQVQSLNGIVELALGETFGCARRTSGDVHCWGDNREGQIGDGTTQSPKPPTPVLGLTGAKAIAAGDAFACAIVDGGKVHCWGKNEHGELGIAPKPALAKKPTNAEQAESAFSPSPGGPPTRIADFQGARTIALGGSFGCALFANGRIHCFGSDEHGELGQTEPDTAPQKGPKPKPTLVPIKGIEGATAIALGAHHACALLADQTARCWGENQNGELGDGTKEKRIGPVVVKDLQGILAIALGKGFSCALLDNGTVRCWGNNDHGKLGDGTQEPRLLPTAVPGLTGAKKLMAKGEHVCVEQSGPTYQCWGQNSENELSDGTTDDRPRPGPIKW